MKKLVLALAIVCATGMMQASTCNWKVTATSAELSKKVYLVQSIGTTFADLAAFADTAIDIGTVAKSGKSSYVVAAHEVSAATITKTANYYLAIVDSENKIHYYDASTAIRESVYDPPNTAPDPAVVSYATIAASTTTATIGGGGDVPEPTSALLLLLGVAGLALKRKQA